jgi:hypothetical protein
MRFSRGSEEISQGLGAGKNRRCYVIDLVQVVSRAGNVVTEIDRSHHL